MRFGWYYECGSVQEEGTDVWALLERAVPEASDDERLSALRVGEMRTLEVSELFDRDDVLSMSDDGRLNVYDIVELVDERAGERIEGGHARLIDSLDAKRTLRRIVQAHRCAQDTADIVVQWAQTHIELDPVEYCHGRFPLPIEYVAGVWRYGCQDPEPPEPSAVITYTESSVLQSNGGWSWWALGAMGDAATLADAMDGAESHLFEKARKP